MVASLFVALLVIAVICVYLVIRAIRVVLSRNIKPSVVVLGLVALVVLIAMVWFPNYYMSHTYMK